YGQSCRSMKCIFYEGRVVGIGLRHENIFAEIRVVSDPRFGAGRHPHADKERGEVAAAYQITRRWIGLLIRGAKVETVRAAGVRRLANIEVALHPLEARRYFMLAPHLSDCSTHVAVLTGIGELVKVAGATELITRAGEVVKNDDRKQLEILLRRRRSNKSQLGKVCACLAGIAPLILVVPGEGIPQLQDGGRI